MLGEVIEIMYFSLLDRLTCNAVFCGFFVFCMLIVLGDSDHCTVLAVKYDTRDSTAIDTLLLTVKEAKNFKTKGKPPPISPGTRLRNSSAMTTVLLKRHIPPLHHSIQQGRKPRTVSHKSNGSSIKINATIHPKLSSDSVTQEMISKLTVARNSSLVLGSELLDVSTDGNESHHNSTVVVSATHMLKWKRSNNGVWAMACLGVLMILLFGSICYSKLWKKRYSGSWIDNLDPKSHLLQEGSIQEVMKSHARFLPMFFKKRPGYSPVPCQGVTPVQRENLVPIEEECETEGDGDEEYKPLL